MDSARLRSELARYGLPAAFLLAATLALVLLRGVLHAGEPAGEAAPPPPRPHVVRRHAPVLPRRYERVESGDTLGAIAAQSGTSLARVLALNPGIDPRALHVGQRVRVK